MGALLFNGDPMCTGTAVSADQVLTAAHCFEATGQERAGWRFAIGPNARSPDREYAVAHIDWLADPRVEGHDRDIALIRLSDAALDPVRCADRVDSSGGVLVGYGWTRRNDGRLTERGVRRSSLVGLAGGGVPSETESVPCAGDSGGPILEGGYGGPLVAIHLAGRRSCGRGTALRLNASICGWLGGRGVRCQ
ncbi:MAG: trypsin-like serine protease [Deltaproteobacteria bacterium]|nr:trypsin-like serine protease [Deltaproteobacteria bacterium]